MECCICINSCRVPLSNHLLSLNPSVFWISDTNQLQQIHATVESIVIRGGLGRGEESFHLSNLPSLVTLVIGCLSFCECHKVVFESRND